MSRGGFSVLEILIVASLLAALVGGAALYQVSGNRQAVALDFRASSLQSAQLLIVHLQRDLASQVPGPLDPAGAPTHQSELAIVRASDTNGKRGLPLDANDQLLTETVTWKFDPATHYVSRNGEPIKAAPFESVEFTQFPLRPGDPSPPYGDTIIVKMVVVPPDALGKVGPATPKAVFTASFSSSQGTINHLHEDWVGDR